MDLTLVRTILDLVREHGLSEFEIEHDGLRLRVRKDATGAPTVAPPTPAVTATVAPAGVPAPLAVPGSPAPAADLGDAEIELAVVKSPIVGTFYRASEPGAKPYAEVGDVVRKGQVLCIIEAMKLMNEINAEADGEIVKVYVENGHAVQYGERLFAIRPA